MPAAVVLPRKGGPNFPKGIVKFIFFKQNKNKHIECHSKLTLREEERCRRYRRAEDSNTSGRVALRSPSAPDTLLTSVTLQFVSREMIGSLSDDARGHGTGLTDGRSAWCHRTTSVSQRESGTVASVNVVFISRVSVFCTRGPLPRDRKLSVAVAGDGIVWLRANTPNSYPYA